MLLTEEEIAEAIADVYDYFEECEKRECVAGDDREAGFDCEGRYLNACEYHQRTIRDQRDGIAKAQAKKVFEWIQTKGYRPTLTIKDEGKPDGYAPQDLWVLDWEDWQSIVDEVN